MAERVLGPTGSRRRRRFLFAPMLLVTAVALLFVAGAQAVHGEAFQLDGDVLASTTTNVGGVTQTVDWDSLFDANGEELPLPANFTASSFDKDFLNDGTDLHHERHDHVRDREQGHAADRRLAVQLRQQREQQDRRDERVRGDLHRSSVRGRVPLLRLGAEHQHRYR